MKIQSFIREDSYLVPVEVEVQLVLGLPQISFLGLPDQTIKESAQRIRTAIKSQGYIFPKAHQVIVNLRSEHQKKNSRGVELAVALGILWLTEQLPRPILDSKTFVYGELTLSGEVLEPMDLHHGLKVFEEPIVYTGQSAIIDSLFRRRVMSSLSDFHQIEDVVKSQGQQWQRPEEGLQLRFSLEKSRWLKMVALSECHVLLAGAAGSGKSTFAKALPSFINPPDRNTYFTTQEKWRPVVKPHHSATALSLIGGGSPPKIGEISRAHQGVLILDEFLEFDPKIQESLREPMEEGKIRLSRSHYQAEFAADFMTVATTNLCPCGHWLPGKEPQCNFSRKKCTGYAEKISGPVLDRYQAVLFFKEERTQGKQALQIKGDQLLNELEQSRAWLKKNNFATTKISEPLESEEILFRVKNGIVWQEIEHRVWHSRRRINSTLQIAVAFANLDLSEEVTVSHWNEALQLTDLNFEKMRRWS